MFFEATCLKATKLAEEWLGPVLGEINADPAVTANEWALILVLGRL